MIPLYVFGAVVAAYAFVAIGYVWGKTSRDTEVANLNKIVDRIQRQSDEWMGEAAAWQRGYSLHLASLTVGDDREVVADEGAYNMLPCAFPLAARPGMVFHWRNPTRDVRMVKKATAPGVVIG
jgi:hypothetical protein